jgi:hypothetical protein
MAIFEIKIEVNGKNSKTEIKNMTPVPDILKPKQYKKDKLKISELLKAIALGLDTFEIGVEKEIKKEGN